jgi:uncharacterized membrane protein
MADTAPRPGAIRAGSLLLGFGFGGLVDGIVLHQVLQWHNLVSRVETNETLEGLRTNLFWDGVFHATTAALVALGLAVLWLAGAAQGRVADPVRTLVGWVLVGWGAFHVVDQLLFHLVLGLHDIREDVASPGLYNWGFFAIGLLLAAVGGWLLRSRAGAPGAPERAGRR